MTGETELQGEHELTALGSGYSTLERKIKNDVLTVKRRFGSRLPNIKVSVCTSQREVFESLSVDASLAIESTFANFKGKFELAKEASTNTQAVTIIVVAELTEEGQTYNEEWSPKFSGSKSALELYDVGGNSYIKSVKLGAFFYAYYQFRARTVELKSKIQAEAESKIGKATTVTAGFKGALDNISRVAETNYTYNVKAGGFKEELPKPDELEDWILKFPKLNFNGPQIMHFETSPYTSAWLTPTWGNENSLKEIDAQARIAIVKIDSVKRIYDFYGQGNVDGKLKDTLEKLHNVMRQLKEWRGKFPESTEPVELKLDLTCFQLPSPRYRLVVGKAYGRPDGDNRPSGTISVFRDVKDDMILQLVYLKSIFARHGAMIDHLDTTYGFRNPLYPNDVSQELTMTVSNGGHENEPSVSEHKNFEPNSINGFGAWINKNPNNWPGFVGAFEVQVGDKNIAFGNVKEDYQSEGMPKSEARLLGFCGRKGASIDTLQPQYVIFEPAVWDPVVWPRED